MTETVCPTKPKIFTAGPFTEEFANSWFRPPSACRRVCSPQKVKLGKDQPANPWQITPTRDQGCDIVAEDTDITGPHPPASPWRGAPAAGQPQRVLHGLGLSLEVSPILSFGAGRLSTWAVVCVDHTRAIRANVV